MKRKRTKVVYIPFQSRHEYVASMKSVLGREYDVIGSMPDIYRIDEMLGLKAVILNWTEYSMTNYMKLQILLCRLLGARIVWVFHNKRPHDQKGTKGLKNMRWLADNVDVIGLHSEHSRRYIPGGRKNIEKAEFIPHIRSKQCNIDSLEKAVREKYGISEKDFVFTMFGTIRPYKTFEHAIRAFDRLRLDNAKLLLVGEVRDALYAQKIERMCLGKPNIVLDFRFIPKDVLDSILKATDVVVAPYGGESSMNSGVMIQAFSMGRTVIASDICMTKDYLDKGFLYCYHSSVEKAMLKAYKNGKEINREMGRRAQKDIDENNNETVVLNTIKKILEDNR